MKFEKLQPGMVLFDVHSQTMGNTTTKTLGTWRVRIVSIDRERRTAMASWNGNAARPYRESELVKLRDKPPMLVRTAFGSCRRPTLKERQAVQAAGLSVNATYTRDDIAALTVGRAE